MQNWFMLMIVGLLSILAGLLALFNPFAASLTVNMIAGWSFLILGALQLYAAFRGESWSGKLWSLLLGVVALILGVNLVANPLQGVLTLTVIAGVLFLVSGLFKLIVGVRATEAPLRWTIVFSGLISALLGFMVLSNIPGAAIVTLGLLLSVELLSNGVSIVALALMVRRGAR